MLVKYTERDLIRSICLALTACARIASLTLLLPALSSAESENAAFSRRYSLSGAVELSYDRYWSQGGATDDFRQLLLLDHRGFVADPNLFTYEVSGTVAHDAGERTTNSTLVGESVGVTLLHSLPDSWKKNGDYIPHPIWLRFSHDADSSFESTNYGLSFMHAVEPKQRLLVIEKVTKAEGEGEGADSDLYEEAPSRTSKIVETERSFPVRTFFDYDHYGLRNQDSPSTSNDILNLRSSLAGKTYDYRFLFENQNQSGPLEIRKNVVQLEPNYRFYDEQTRRRIDIRNFLRYEELNQGTSTQVNSSFTWSKPMGKDALALMSNLGYTGTSTAGQNLSNYIAAASGTYTHQLSSRLTNSSQLAASYTKNYNVDNHNERLSDTVSADISRIFGGTASAYVGNGSEGIEYGAGFFLFTKTRIQTSLGYSYSLASSQVLVTNLPQQTSTKPSQVSNEKTSSQTLSLRATGPLLSNLSFQASYDLTLADVPFPGGTSHEESNSLASSILWRLSKTSMTLGGNYTQLKKEDTATSETSSTSLYATLSRALPNNLLFNLYNTWTKTIISGVQNSEETRYGTKPSLRWTRGLTTVDAEYSYEKSMGAGPAAVENRFFVRLVRKFSAIF